jgi:hypothetical protein
MPQEIKSQTLLLIKVKVALFIEKLKATSKMSREEEKNVAIIFTKK